MPHQINTNDCVKCGLCISTCPVDAIKESAGVIQVDADECVDCQACARVCPVQCIDGGYDKYLDLKKG